ncbi:MAG: hypothetical protein ACR2KL_10955 [Nocardioidaceae bacterium]
MASSAAVRDENTCRKDMSPEELIDMTTLIEQMARADNKAKQGTRTDLATFSSAEEKVARDRSTWTNEIVADALGMSRPSYERIKQVVTRAIEQMAQADNAAKQAEGREFGPRARSGDWSSSGEENQSKPDRSTCLHRGLHRGLHRHLDLLARSLRHSRHRPGPRRCVVPAAGARQLIHVLA